MKRRGIDLYAFAVYATTWCGLLLIMGLTPAVTRWPS